MDYSQLPITNQATIPEEYIDVMGHVNIMWYTHLFDEAVYELWGLFGCGKEYYRSSGYGGFALEQHTLYLSEVRVGDSVTVRSRALGRSDKTFHFMHFLIRDVDNVLAATGEFVGVHIDRSTRRSAPFPDEALEKLDVLLAAHQQLDWDAPVCGVMGIKRNSD
jgi:acyl-CoA thioester hydrolase